MAGYMVPQVWCDKCGRHVVADIERTVTDLRRRVKAEGWRRVEDAGTMEDRCPDCAATVEGSA